MFCYQCEQTAKGTGCTVLGVCGKKPEVAALQDLLLYTLMGLSQVAVEARKIGVIDNDVNLFTVKAAFSTLTNVDFDPNRFMDLISQAAAKRDDLKTQLKTAGTERIDQTRGAGWVKILSRRQSGHFIVKAHGPFRYKGCECLCGTCRDLGAGGRQRICLCSRGACSDSKR